MLLIKRISVSEFSVDIHFVLGVRATKVLLVFEVVPKSPIATLIEDSSIITAEVGVVEQVVFFILFINFIGRCCCGYLTTSPPDLLVPFNLLRYRFLPLLLGRHALGLEVGVEVHLPLTY